jgi:RimJ/RimL family protein N-acetyltransferase
MNVFLETERLYLREIKEDDLPLLFELHSDPEVMKFIRPAEKTLDETRATMERILRTNNYPEGIGLWICQEKSSNEFIGWFVLKPLENTPDIEIGYRLLRKQWGKGFATEMSHELLNYCFNVTGLSKIAAATHPDNHASQHVLEKIGLRFVRRQQIHNINACIYERLRNAD